MLCGAVRRCAVLCSAVLPLSRTYQKKKVSTLPEVCTACSVRVVILDGAWSSWHLQSCLHLELFGPPIIYSVPFFLASNRRATARCANRLYIHTHCCMWVLVTHIYPSLTISCSPLRIRLPFSLFFVFALTASLPRRSEVGVGMGLEERHLRLMF